MPEIKGDYQGKLKTIKATADAKLETVATVDTIGTINRLNSSGTLKNIPWVWDDGLIDYTVINKKNSGIITSPGFTGLDWKPLAINTDGELILDTLGTVERVKNIDNLGTVGRLATIGMIEAGTISEVTHVGTIGDINHLGSIGNTSFDQGSVLDHKREMYGWDESDWEKVRTDTGGKLKTAPATSRKGGVQTVANAGTAVALVASSTPVIGVIVKAQHENLGTIYVGDSTVDDTHGFLLRRDEFVSFSCQNAGSVFIDASRDAQKVSALYINY